MDPQISKDDENHSTTIKVNVKFSGRSIPIEIAADSTVKNLKSVLQNITNVLPRGQKLIFKGKVLSDESTLVSCAIINGSKIMLIASQGLHQGDGPIKKEEVAVPNIRRVPNFTREKKGKMEDSIKSKLEIWKITGVISLTSSGLTTIPEEVWTCGPSARVLDLRYNSLNSVPSTIGGLSSIQKLVLSGNHLLDNSIGWDGITSLKSLLSLQVDQNNLTALPSSIGALTRLKHLHISGNKLICIPSEIGELTALQVLKAQNNRLNTIPTSIGKCISLVEVNLSGNLLPELPDTFGNLRNLKILLLANNGLKSLPSTLFKSCLQLSIIDLHGTEITTDILRQFEGWESFEERRRLKHQKQLDFRVAGSGEFDEGADKKW